MNWIRKVIVAIFGLKGYVRLVSWLYIRMVRNGFLKDKYPELFFLRSIVKKGDVAIDIGANLGYYSVILSEICGAEGKVYAVEPIPLFADMWKRNVRKSGIDNLSLYQNALGAENKTVKMGVPVVDGVVHHGMTKVVEKDDDAIVRYFEVEMKNPDELFSGLEKLDFIKCDVEGYESEVFGNMQVVIKKHKPLIQSELSGSENRMKVIGLMKAQGYSVNILQNSKLVAVEDSQLSTLNQDFYFIPQSL